MHKFPEIGTRLKRAQGHLAAVIDMLEAGRPCMDLAQQLHAVEKAIGNVSLSPPGGSPPRWSPANKLRANPWKTP